MIHDKLLISNSFIFVCIMVINYNDITDCFWTYYLFVNLFFKALRASVSNILHISEDFVGLYVDHVMIKVLFSLY
jgi:hypothetical protein